MSEKFEQVEAFLSRITPSGHLARRSVLDKHFDALLELKRAGCSSSQQQLFLHETFHLDVTRQTIDAWWKRRDFDAKRFSPVSGANQTKQAAALEPSVPSQGPASAWPDLTDWVPNARSNMPASSQAAAERAKRAAEQKAAGFGQSVLSPRKPTT